MSTPLDVLEAQLSAHGWERGGGLGLVPEGLARTAQHPEGLGRCTQFVDWLGGDWFRVWGGGLGASNGNPLRSVDVVPFLRERGAM